MCWLRVVDRKLVPAGRGRREGLQGCNALQQGGTVQERFRQTRARHSSPLTDRQSHCLGTSSEAR